MNTVTLDRELVLLRDTLEQGVPRLYRATEGMFCNRVVLREGFLVPEGHSLRHTTICLLGLAKLGDMELDLSPALQMVARYSDNNRVGDIGLMLWALAANKAPATYDAVNILVDYHRFYPWESLADSGTTELAWVLSGIVEATLHGYDSPELRVIGGRVAEELISRQHDSGLFRGTSRLSRFRLVRRLLQQDITNLSHQVFAIEALAKWSALTGEPEWHTRAITCARVLAGLQGRLGQWPRAYHQAAGELAELFPIYSVYQHSLVPMALISLGLEETELIASLQLGLGWLFGRNEVGEQICVPERGVIWRSVQPKSQSEPDILDDQVSGMESDDWPGLYRNMLRSARPMLSRKLAVQRLMYSYELGWLAYAWEGMAQALKHRPQIPKANANSSPDLANPVLQMMKAAGELYPDQSYRISAAEEALRTRDAA